MYDPILREIRHSLAETSPGNWYTAPSSTGGEHQIYAALPSGDTCHVVTARTAHDAHFIAYAKDYISHLLNLLERQNDAS